MGFYLMKPTLRTTAEDRPAPSPAASLRHPPQLASKNPHRGPASNRILSSKYRDEMGLCYYGQRHYSPSLGRWLSRDGVNDQRPRVLLPARPAPPAGTSSPEDSTPYSFVGNRTVDHVDPWGDFPVPVPAPPLLITPVTPISWSALINMWTARNFRTLEARLQALCPTHGSVEVSPVMNPRQCCRSTGPMSCRAQATKFASDYTTAIKGVLDAEAAKHGDILGGWLLNGRRRWGGRPDLGGDGFYCYEWAEKAKDILNASLLRHWGSNSVCFRGAQVSKGGTFWWFFSDYHSWFMIYGPNEVSPSYVVTGNTVTIDPWWSGGELVIPRSPYTAVRYEAGSGVFLSVP
jgi:RHS repeat-associated protein